MDIEVIEERENPLLERKEIKFRIKHENKGRTPSRKDVRELLVKEFKTSPNLLVVDSLRSEFGKREVIGYAKIYRSEGKLRSVERPHILRRNFEE
ncbi:30S ribosomal protein S24e [Candidatus Alkanophaga liquidiphilum]|nr:Ribosomal protein S24E [Candidatus Alkanophaga liquidiphilum]